MLERKAETKRRIDLRHSFGRENADAALEALFRDREYLFGLYFGRFTQAGVFAVHPGGCPLVRF
jgi:hypothetical protein